MTYSGIDEIRRDMLEHGFTLVNTPRFFDDSRVIERTRGRMVLPGACKTWYRYPDLARYAAWLQRLLNSVLPEELLALVTLELRHERAGTVDKEVDRLHADGSYLRSVFAVHGPATIYREARVERSVPEGQTLLLTAMDRARTLGVPCTLHRRPGPDAEHVVIVCSFAPPARIPLSA